MSKYTKVNTLFGFSIILSGLAGRGYAQNDSVEPTKKEETALETVEVTGERIYTSSEEQQKYKIDKSSTATRMSIPVQETPQTINTVTRKQLQDFDLRDGRDAIKASPGMVIQRTETERTSYVSRGSEVSTIQIDGLGIPYDGYNLQTSEIDTYIYDRVEILKGANGLSSSLGEPGATINFARKRPTLDLKYGAGVSYGSWNTSRLEGDVSGPVVESKAIRARVVGALQKGDSYLDNYSLKKGVVSAVIEADLSDSTSLTIGHFTQANAVDGNNWGSLPLMSAEGNQIEYSRSTNPVPSWTNWDQNTHNSFAELRQDLGTDWQVRATYQYEKIDGNSRLAYYYGNPTSTGAGVGNFLGRYIDQNYSKFVDVNLNGRFELFGRFHEATIGTNWSKNEKNERELGGPGYGSVANWNGFDGGISEPEWSTGAPGGGLAAHSEITSIYGATRLHLADDWKLLLGVNNAKSNGSGSSFGVRQDFDRTRALPYAGLTYQFLPKYLAYTSFNTIYRPQIGLDASGKTLEPTEGRAYEFGLKASWLNDKLSGSIAQFNTDQKHFPLRASDLSARNRTYDVGRLKTYGYELNLVGEVYQGTDLSAGFVSTRMYDGKEKKETRTYLPSRVANLLLSHKLAFLPEARVGVGATYQSKVFQDTDVSVYDASGTLVSTNTYRIRQGDYTLLDLMAGYDLSEDLSLQANFKNVSNKKYLLSFPYASAFYGAPANYMVSLTYQN